MLIEKMELVTSDRFQQHNDPHPMLYVHRKYLTFFDISPQSSTLNPSLSQLPLFEDAPRVLVVPFPLGAVGPITLQTCPAPIVRIDLDLL